MSISQFMHDSVYPNLDAVESGLLEHLSPKRSVKTYIMRCPKCDKNEAFYYPNSSSAINCPRKNECGDHTTIWDVVAETCNSNKEVFEILCSAAGVTPPANDKSFELTLSRLIVKITQSATQSDEGKKAVSAFLKLRNLSQEQFNQLGYGYYPNNAYVLQALKNAGADMVEAENLGFVKQGKKSTFLDKRIVGFWQQIDGTYRLWGRSINNPPEGQPKYWFASNEAAPMSKGMPYRFKKASASKPYICVEGTLDADALILTDYNGVAIGQALINHEQAMFFAKAGVTRVMHLTDGDKAGYEGAIGTLSNTLPLGIETSISILGRGMDDIDKLRQNGQTDMIHSAVRSGIPGAEFLANIVVASYWDSKLVRLRPKIFSIIDDADTITEGRFNTRLALLGFPRDRRVDASKLFSNLLSGGATEEVANEIIKNKFGLSASLEGSNCE